jgi:hypothetical protein
MPRKESAMKFEGDVDKIVRISISIENHIEQMEDRCDEALGWREGQQADIGWCVGVHVASILNKILASHERDEALRAINDSLDPESTGKIY